MRSYGLRSTTWIAALLVLATFGVFWPGLSGGFIFDDYSNLVLEDGWKLDTFAPGEWATALGSGIASPAGRPLAIASFAFNHVLSGMDPFWLKFTGLALHALNGLLIFMLAARLLRLAPAHPVQGLLAPSLLAAAWLLHPLQVSSALYIVQRMELGAATGTLVTLLAYIQMRQAQLRGATAWPWLIAMACAMAFGLGFKETAALAPGFAFLVELIVFRFCAPSGRFSRGWLAAYGLGAVLALALCLTIMQPLLASEALYATREFTLSERMWTQLPVLAMYLRQSLLPAPESLWFYYDNFQISRGLFSPMATAWSGLALVSLLTLACACWRRWPLVSLGIAWFFMGHVLTSSVIPLELAFEHRNYLALFGVLLALTQPLDAIGARLHADARAVLATLPVLALAVLCWTQAASWGEPLRLAWTLENRNSSSQRASYELGRQLLQRAGDDPSSPAWGLAHLQLRHAAALPGPSPLPIQGLMLAEARAGRPIARSTWVALRERLLARRLGPEGLSALFALSQCRITGACRFDDSELLITFLEVLPRNPDSATVHTIYANFAWNVLHDRTLAIDMQRTAVLIAPASDEYRIALAKFLLTSGDQELTAEGIAIAKQLARSGDAPLLKKQLDELAQLLQSAQAQANIHDH